MRALSINVRDEVTLTVGDRRVDVKVVDIFKSQTQSDVEILVPIEAANRLAGNSNTISLIEFSSKKA